MDWRRFGAAFLAGSTVALSGAGTLIKDYFPSYSGYVWVPVAVLVFLACAQSLYASRPEKRNRVVVETSLRIFLEVTGLSRLDSVRCLLWIPDPKTDYLLLPACRYVPAEKEVSLKRLHSSEGIVGLAYRTQEPQVEILPLENFPTPEDIQKWLVSKWGFSKQTTSSHLRDDRRSYCAIPILTSQATPTEVVGVIYCDTKQLLDHDEVKSIMETAVKIAPIFTHLLEPRGTSK